MADDDEWIDDEDLLIEAARYAVRTNDVSRNAFMKAAKRAWYRAAIERGRNPQTLGGAWQGRAGRG
jgi:hypothetical protein